MNRHKRIQALFKADLQKTKRKIVQLLLLVSLPALLLAFLNNAEIIQVEATQKLAFLTPATLSVGLCLIPFVWLTTTIAADQTDGTINRYSITPLTAKEYIAAKLLSAALLCLIQSSALIATAFYFGWKPQVSFQTGAAILLAIGGFSSLAIAIVAVFKTSATLMAQTIYLLFFIASGIFFQDSELTMGTVRTLKIFPTKSLTHILHTDFTGTASQTWAWITLATWFLATSVIAAKLFRWK